MSKPLTPLIVTREGLPWILGPRFDRSATYRHHLASLQRVGTYEEMLERLEQLVIRLRRVATIDRRPAATQEEWLQRSAEKTNAFFEHECVVHDLRRGVGYAVRFLNTTAVYGSGPSQKRALAQRAGRAICSLLFPSHGPGRGRRRSAPAPASVRSIRSDFLREVRQIWVECDVSERRASLMKAIAARDWRVPSLPITVGQKPPSRVADLVVSQHTGIGQRRLRPAGTAAIAQFIYQ